MSASLSSEVTDSFQTTTLAQLANLVNSTAATQTSTATQSLLTGRPGIFIGPNRTPAPYRISPPISTNLAWAGSSSSSGNSKNFGLILGLSLGITAIVLLVLVTMTIIWIKRMRAAKASKFSAADSSNSSEDGHDEGKSGWQTKRPLSRSASVRTTQSSNLGHKGGNSGDSESGHSTYSYATTSYAPSSAPSYRTNATEEQGQQQQQERDLEAQRTPTPSSSSGDKLAQLDVELDEPSMFGTGWRWVWNWDSEFDAPVFPSSIAGEDGTLKSEEKYRPFTNLANIQISEVDEEGQEQDQEQGEFYSVPVLTRNGGGIGGHRPDSSMSSYDAESMFSSPSSSSESSCSHSSFSNHHQQSGSQLEHKYTYTKRCHSRQDPQHSFTVPPTIRITPPTFPSSASSTTTTKNQFKVRRVPVPQFLPPSAPSPLRSSDNDIKLPLHSNTHTHLTRSYTFAAARRNSRPLSIESFVSSL